MIRAIFSGVESKKTRNYAAFNKPFKKAVLAFLKEDERHTVAVYCGGSIDIYDKNNIEEFES